MDTIKEEEKQNAVIEPRAIIGAVNVWCAHDELAPIGALAPHPRNPNRHPKAQIKRLADIIAGNGFRNAITVSNLSGHVIKGHGRLAAARLLGIDRVPIERQQYRDEAEELADLLADNRIAELAELDMESVGDILHDLIQIDFDIELTGFDVKDIGEINAIEYDQSQEEIDRIKNDLRQGVFVAVGFCEILIKPGDVLFDLFFHAVGKKYEYSDDFKAKIVKAISDAIR